MPQRSVLVLPDDGAQPLLEIVGQARHTLRVKMFVFTDPAMLAAVAAARARGVDVRVMLNPARRDGADDNADSRAQLKRAGVAVRDSSPHFELTHEKSMVVDDRLAVVMSLNWDPKNLSETRDYAIVTDHPREVEEVVAGFEADWAHKRFEPAGDSHLIWCNHNGRDRIGRFIDSARHSLFVQNERYQDEVIIEHLVRAQRRGVKVHVMARPLHTLKKDKLVEGVGGLRILDDIGIEVRKVKGLKLHGKLLLADRSRAVVGSINLAPGSFDHRRELAIEVHDEAVVDRLHEVVRHDWHRARPLDLTDEGLIADLEDREEDAARRLGLHADVKRR